MLNYWRTASTELTALAPRVPFLGRKGTFKSDARKWATVNSQNHAFIEYDARRPPQRQAAGQRGGDRGDPGGAKRPGRHEGDIGMYDASLGAAGNETRAGRSSRGRRRGIPPTSFHRQSVPRDRACGRILIDLIPTVYSGRRMIRVLGADNKASSVAAGAGGAGDGRGRRAGD